MEVEIGKKFEEEIEKKEVEIRRRKKK